MATAFRNGRAARCSGRVNAARRNWKRILTGSPDLAVPALSAATCGGCCLHHQTFKEDIPMTRYAYICYGVRTPFGRYGGILSGIRTDDLAALPLRSLMARHSGVDWEAVTDVIFGCANQAGEDNRNVARMASLLAGLPQSLGGATINRLCGSGMD